MLASLAASGAAGVASARQPRAARALRGPTSAFTPRGIERTADEDDSTYIFHTIAPLDLRAALICDWRDGDVW